MTDIAFPSGLAPSSMEWRLERNVARFESPTSRAVQTVARGGDRWHCTLTMPQLTGEDAGILVAWLDQISRAEHCGLLPALHNRLTSKFAVGAPPLLSSWRNGELSNWTVLSTVRARVAGGRLVLRNLADPAASIRRAVATAIGATYVLIVDIPTYTASCRVVIGTSNFSSVFVQSVNPPAGRLILKFVATTASTGVSLQAGPGVSPGEYDEATFGDVLLFRVLETDTAASAGTAAISLLGDDYDGSTSDQMSIGQFFSVVTTAGIELKRSLKAVSGLEGVTYNGRAVNGGGQCAFEPALRAPVALNAAIIHSQPWCRMRLADANSVSTISAPNFTGTTIELIEDVT